MATARTNQLSNVSFTVTAGTAKSLKITSDSRSNFDSSLEHKDARMQHAVVQWYVHMYVGLSRGIAQLHTYGLPSNNATSRAEKI